MDSITHLALGACMGEAFAGKKLGKKAMLWGAMAQSVADIDFITSFWMDTPSALLAHRGFTHSFLFLIFITPLLALLAERWHRPHNISLFQWIIFFGSVIFIHIFIDAFNNYGVGWFEPFSHARISFNAIYVADPFFSLLPGIAGMVLLLLGRRSPLRKKWWRLGLIVPALYLGLCIFNKTRIDADVRSILHNQQIPYTRYFTTPAPLQNWLWFVVAGDDNGYYTGYRSLADNKKEIKFRYFPRNDTMLAAMGNQEQLLQLVRFSRQFYTVEKWNDTLVFNDLRFGQVNGWEDPGGHFAFHYFLQYPDDNKMVVQRGRFSGWTRKVFMNYIDRVLGN
jgi:inner membrane protein